MQTINDHIINEFFGRQRCEIRIELDHVNFVDPGLEQVLNSPVKRAQGWRSSFRAKDRARVRIERHGNKRHLQCVGEFAATGNEQLVAPMNAIEGPDAYDVLIGRHRVKPSHGQILRDSAAGNLPSRKVLTGPPTHS